MATSNGITGKAILGYFLMPRVIPRVRNLFSSGFGYIAFLMAQVYGMVRLLPQNHPYLDPQNIGKFGIRHTVVEASNNLVLKKQNIDQIVIFGAILAGIVLLALQLVAVIYSFIFQPAMAQLSVFNTQNPQNDIALTLMDRIFGVPKLTCNVDGVCTQYGDAFLATDPTAFHQALHGMFQFYSLGILLVGVLIFLYYLVIVVGETATTGTPFGQRFQNVWVPIRLITAIGLLLPLNYGLNSAQYITLYAAKFGSGLATNGWTQFNRALTTGNDVFDGGNISDDGTVSNENFNPLGEKNSLIAKPESPDVSPIVQFVALAHACAYSYWKQNPTQRARPPLIFNPTAIAGKPPANDFRIHPYLVKHVYPWMQKGGGNVEEWRELKDTSYTQAIDFYHGGDIVIRFGERNLVSSSAKGEKGNVLPYCGEIRVHISDIANKGRGGSTGGPDAVQQFFFESIKSLWYDNTTLHSLSQQYVEFNSNIQPNDPCAVPGATGNCDTAPPPGAKKQGLINNLQSALNDKIQEAWEKYADSGAGAEYTQEMFGRGWGGAGIWYNQIAKINGNFIGSVQRVPSVGQDGMPWVMREVREARSLQDTEITGMEMYCPNLENGNPVPGMPDDDLKIAQVLCDYFKYWNKDSPNQIDTEDIPIGNAFQDAMAFVFGLSGLFAMRGENADIHPLAQLAALGKGLVDSAVRNIAGSSALSFGGGLFSALGLQKIGSGFGIASEAISSVAFIGLTAGVILFYILPFMPFIYFFFAVGSWLKTIFEAMVGVPLWALAHLRLDGEGLPGESAANGYFLILEIMIRPILTVFGLIGAMIIFSTQVRILHFIWDIVLDNLSGFEGDPVLEFAGQNLNRGITDQFFFTIVYAIICYMLANASFKLIDKIPDNILRWMGSPVSSFSDSEQDTLDQLNRYVAFGGISIGQQGVGAFKQASEGAGRGLGGVLGALGRSGS